MTALKKSRYIYKQGIHSAFLSKEIKEVLFLVLKPLAASLGKKKYLLSKEKSIFFIPATFLKNLRLRLSTTLLVRLQGTAQPIN